MDTEINKVERKIDDLQKYVPYLIQITENLKRDGNKEDQLNQMQLLHKLLTSPNKKLSIQLLLKCEEVLERCFGQAEKDLSSLDVQQQGLSYLLTSSLLSLLATYSQSVHHVILEEENKSEDDCANDKLQNEKNIEKNLAEDVINNSNKTEQYNSVYSNETDDVKFDIVEEVPAKNDKNLRSTPEIHTESSLNSEDQVKETNGKSDKEENLNSRVEDTNIIKLNNEEINQNSRIQVTELINSVKDPFVNAEETDKKKNIETDDVKDSLQNINLTKSTANKNEMISKDQEGILKVKSSQEMIEENISIGQESGFNIIVNESNDKNLIEIDVADTESKPEQLKSYDKMRNDFLIENSDNRSSQQNQSEAKSDTITTKQNIFEKLENYEIETNVTDKSKTDQNILKEIKDKEVIKHNEKSSENIESSINVNNKVLKLEEIKNSERSVSSSSVSVIQQENLNEINDSLSNCKIDKQETKIVSNDNNKDPLLLDKDFESQIKNGEASDLVPENTLSKLIVSESDISRLVQEKKIRRSERQQMPTSCDNNIKNNQKCSEKNSLSYSFKDKSKVVYLVKKDPCKSVETIELLDSDEEFYGQDNGNDDDVILVSTKGLKKPSHKIIKKIQHSSGTQTFSKSKLKPTETMPMFAISSVQSFGTPKALSAETDIKNHSLLTEQSLVGTNSSIRLKKYEPFSNDYQATLRVCTPTKQPETSKYTRDFLSAFRNFSKNQTSTSIKADSKKSSKANQSKKKSLFFQLPEDDSTTTTSTSDSTSNHSSSNNNSFSSLQTNNKCKDDQVNKEWLDNFVTNILSPTQIKSKQVLDILYKSVDPERYHQLKTIINYHNNPEEICTSLVVSEKVLKLLPDGGTVEKLQLIVKSINEVNIEKLNQEIRELFIKNGKITETGKKVCQISGKIYNKVLTRDRRNGQITSKSRRSKYDQDNNESDDEEYTPKCNVSVNEQIIEERRRSLRRDSKQINWKQYFNNEDDDYGNDADVAVHQLNKPKMNKKKSSLIKRSNGESGAEFMLEHERKKIKIEANKTTIQTPFDTDLLTPIWFESEDPERNSSQEDFNYCEKRRKSYASSTTAASTSTYAYDDSSRLKEEEEEEEQITNEKNCSKSTPPEKVLNYMNTNPAYHCRSKFIDSCLICKEKVQHAVTHYVNQHPEYEVIISRLTQRDVDYISQNINYAFITDSKEKSDTNRTCQYTALCVFCKRDMNFALRYWWEHFTMHTGEYGYECTGCKAKRPRKQSTQTHINNQCERKRKAKVREIYEFDKSITEIYAYICVLCNYIQLHEKNLLKHLKIQHNMNENEFSSHIIVISLIQFSKPFGDLNEQQQQIDQNLMKIDYNLRDYMEYSSVMQSNDDLSFTICNMLATDVPELETNNDK